MPFINVRWADNTSELKKHLKEGVDQIEVTRASVDKLTRSLGGENIIAAAHKYAAAVNEIGGAANLTAANQARVNAVMTKAVDVLNAAGKGGSDLAKHFQSLADQTKQVGESASKSVGSLSSLTDIASRFGGIIGGAFSVGAIVSFAKEMSAAADQLLRLHDITGISLQGLQRFQAAGDDAGNSLDEITNAIVKMEDRLVSGNTEAGAALTKLGLSFQDLKRLTPENQFIAISEAIRKIEDPAEQVNIAIDLFGKSGASVLPTLKRGFDDLKGSVVGMSDETIRALDDAGDALSKFWRQGKAGGAELLVMLGRLAAEGFNPMGYAIRRAGDEAANAKRQIDELIKSVSAAAPKMAKIAPPGLPDDLELIERDLKRIQSANDAAWKKGIDDRKRYAESVEKIKEKIREMEAVLPQLTHSVGQLDSTELKSIETHLKNVEATAKLNQEAKKLQDTLNALQRVGFQSVTDGLEKVGTKVPILSEAQTKIIAAKMATSDWGRVLQDLSDTFTQLAQISGPTFSEIARAIGVAVVSIKQLQHAISQAAQEQKDFGKVSLATNAEVALSIVNLGIALQSYLYQWEKSKAAQREIENNRRLVVQLGKDFQSTAQFSQQLADSIRDVLRTRFDVREGDPVPDYARKAAEALKLADIIKEMGGFAHLTGVQLAYVADRLKILFGYAHGGDFQAVADLDAILADMGATATKSGGLVSKLFLDMVSAAKQVGIELEKVNAFLLEQTKNIATGLAAFAKGPGVITSQSAASALSASVLAAFTEMQRQGVSVSEIIAQLGPVIEDLAKKFDAAGFSGGAAFDAVREMAALAKDEIAGPIIDGINGLGQALIGLHNIGALDADTFLGLTRQIKDGYNALVAQGKGGASALRLLQQPLQTIWALHKDTGMAIDAETQALLDEAEAQGIVGDKQRPIQEQMLLATKKISDAVEYLAKAFGYVGDEAEDAADDINNAFGKIKVPKIKIPIDWALPDGTIPYVPPPPLPPAEPGERIPIPPPIITAMPSGVIPQPLSPFQMRTDVGGLSTDATATRSTTIVLQETFQITVDSKSIDAQDAGQFFEKVGMPMIVGEIEDRRRGYAGRIAAVVKEINGV